jgi:hypothetical protein
MKDPCKIGFLSLASVGMSDNESFDEDLNDTSECLQNIHKHMEELSHLSKHIYSRALRVQQLTENPGLDLWAEPFKLDERAYKWAKAHLVPRKCSLWQIHQTLLESARKEERVFVGQRVSLAQDEADIMGLPCGVPISVWLVLAALPKFFA